MGRWIKRMLIAADGDTIGADHVPAEIAEARAPAFDHWRSRS